MEEFSQASMFRFQLIGSAAGATNGRTDIRGSRCSVDQAYKVN